MAKENSKFSKKLGKFKSSTKQNQYTDREKRDIKTIMSPKGPPMILCNTWTYAHQTKEDFWVKLAKIRKVTAEETILQERKLETSREIG